MLHKHTSNVVYGSSIPFLFFPSPFDYESAKQICGDIGFSPSRLIAFLSTDMRYFPSLFFRIFFLFWQETSCFWKENVDKHLICTFSLTFFFTPSCCKKIAPFPLFSVSHFPPPPSLSLSFPLLLHARCYGNLTSSIELPLLSLHRFLLFRKKEHCTCVCKK